MSDEQKTDQGAIQDTGIDKPAGTVQSTPISAEEFESLKKTLDDQKKEISGLNRKNTEYEKAIQQKELEKLNEADRAKAELEIIRQEKLKTENEIKELSLSRVKDKALIDSGIPIEFAKRINGQDEAEIQADVKAFKEYFDKCVKEASEKIINEKLSGKPPVSGGTVSGKVITEAQFNAMNPRDHAAFFASGGKIEG